MLYCKDVSKSYSGKKVLNNVNLHFPSGTVYLNGANGSGKSTLIRLLAGIEQPDTGQIEFGHAACQSLSLSTDSVQVPDVFTPNELYSLQERYNQLDDKLFNKLCNDLKLTEFLNCKIAELSTGTKKKFSVISALIKQSKILLLDEPFNGLDNNSIDYLAHLITTDRRDKIIVDHYQLLSSSHAVEL